MSTTPAHPRTALAAFERMYREQVGDVMRFFARRCEDPQLVADLTADTFVRAITAFTSFDPRRGSARAWLLGIARRVAAAHWADTSQRGELVRRIGGQRELDADQFDDLAGRIDAERAGRELLVQLEVLPRLDREAIELVDLAGLSPKEAASVLGVPRGAMRARLHRARSRLRQSIRTTSLQTSSEEATHEQV